MAKLQGALGEVALEFGHFQASRSDRMTVAVGNAHGLRGFSGWRRGATYDR
jgi:hypothetical protein